jgi:hypothetical protein
VVQRGVEGAGGLAPLGLPGGLEQLEQPGGLALAERLGRRGQGASGHAM